MRRAPGTLSQPGRLVLVCLFAGGLLTSAFAQDEADSLSTPYHQAFLNYKSGNYQAALIAIDQAAQDNPDNINTQILKARIQTELLQFDDAKKTLEGLNDNPHFTPADGANRTLAMADLCLRRRDFDGATKLYESVLTTARPDDPDLILKVVYSRVGANDLGSALSYSSKLKPLDQVDPAYYFAKAALAQATGDSASADQDLQTVTTLYGITVSNRYLKTYLQLFSGGAKNSISARAEPPASGTNAPPVAPTHP
jgi:tetratricopeptide (TPR) repeat protein